MPMLGRRNPRARKGINLSYTILRKEGKEVRGSVQVRTEGEGTEQRTDLILINSPECGQYIVSREGPMPRNCRT